MSIQENLEKMKQLQYHILMFLDNQDKDEENFQQLIKIIDDIKIRERQQDLRLLLKLLSQISDNHHRCADFFDKIEQIFRLFKEDFKKFEKSELFEIFHNNFRILLFLFEEKIIIFDEYIADIMVEKSKPEMMWRYLEFFYREIYAFIKKINLNDAQFDFIYENMKEPEKLQEDNYKKRKIGLNDSYICELIRNDSIVEFIVFVNKNNLNLNKKIPRSVYETNSILYEGRTSLIKYATFYGSIRILQYLFSNGAKIDPYIWIYAIHSNNSEIINFLEEKQIEPENGSYLELFDESIKCHHNEIAHYIMNNLLDSPLENISSIIKYYNFEFIDYNDLITNKSHCIFDLVKYNYTNIVVDLLLKCENIDINEIHDILIIILLNEVAFFKYFNTI